MVVTDLLAFRQAKEKEEKERKKVHRFTFLGSRAHSAWYRDHTCCKCSCPISGGMTYIREVYATYSGIYIKKFHWPVCPDHYWRESEEDRERHEAAIAKIAA